MVMTKQECPHHPGRSSAFVGRLMLTNNYFLPSINLSKFLLAPFFIFP